MDPLPVVWRETKGERRVINHKILSEHGRKGPHHKVARSDNERLERSDFEVMGLTHTKSLTSLSPCSRRSTITDPAALGERVHKRNIKAQISGRPKWFGRLCPVHPGGMEDGDLVPGPPPCLSPTISHEHEEATERPPWHMTTTSPPASPAPRGTIEPLVSKLSMYVLGI